LDPGTVWRLDNLNEQDVLLVGRTAIAWAHLESVVNLAIEYLLSLPGTEGCVGEIPRPFKARMRLWKRLAQQAHTDAELERLNGLISSVENHAGKRGRIVHSVFRENADTATRYMTATLAQAPSHHVIYTREPKGRVHKLPNRIVQTTVSLHRFYQIAAEHRGHEFDVLIERVSP
jgi:hypothetical protein